MTLKARAKMKLIELLALRDHSEKELRQKIKRSLTPKWRRERPTPDEETLSQLKKEIEAAVTEAMEFAAAHQYLAEPEKISQLFETALHRKKKGIRYINNYLAQKGLPSVKADPEIETEKARELLKRKYPAVHAAPRDIKAKAMRFLASRGFSMETIQKALKYDDSELSRD
jgi:regulatory protein